MADRRFKLNPVGLPAPSITIGARCSSLALYSYDSYRSKIGTIKTTVHQIVNEVIMRRKFALLFKEEEDSEKSIVWSVTPCRW
jgi:hypothetical protein